jgi:hypothetical protein
MFATNMPSYYCAGRDLSAGDAMGRLGSPWGNNNSVLTSPYGWQWDGVNSQNVPVYCSNPGNVYCTVQNEGFSSCNDPNGGSTHPRWNHPVTVYRNFESSMLYKICNKYGKCLGVLGGSTAAGTDVEQRSYSASAGQTWQILQVSPGNYKIINKTSGMALTATGSTVEQQPYTGASNQIMPMNYISADRGFANLKTASNTSAIFIATNNASGDGVVVHRDRPGHHRPRPLVPPGAAARDGHVDRRGLRLDQQRHAGAAVLELERGPAEAVRGRRGQGPGQADHEGQPREVHRAGRRRRRCQHAAGGSGLQRQ